MPDRDITLNFCRNAIKGLVSWDEVIVPKIRHHYIPQFCLRGFLDPDQENSLWVYDKDLATVFPSTPLNIACEKHYHSFINEEGERDTETIEHLYEVIESNTSPILEKIHANTPLDEEDKSKFSVFVASMMLRVPNHRKNIEKAVADVMIKMEKMLASDKEAFEASYEKFLGDTGANQDMSAEEIRQFILSGKYTATTNPQASLSLSVKSIKDMANVFYQMNWLFIRATVDHKFLSGDNPLFYFDPIHNPKSFYGVSLMNKHIEVTLPLSKEICAFGGWLIPGKYSVVSGKNQLVKDLNRRTVLATLRYVFASKNSDTLLRFVTKYKGSAPVFKIS